MKSCAIYITDNLIRFGQITFQKKQSAVLEQEIKPAFFKKFLHENKISPEHLILGIPRTQVNIRYLTFPTVNDNEIRQMVEYDLNNLFPYKAEEMIFDYTVIQKSADGYSQVMLVAVQKEIILKHMAFLKQSGLVPDEIDVSSVALFNHFLEQKKPQENYLLVNLDDGLMDIVQINEQKIKFSRAVSFKDKLEKQNLIRTVEQTTTILQDKGDKISKIILCGKGYALEEFAQSLEQSVSLKVEADKNLGVISGLLAKDKPDAVKINLLPQESKIKKVKDKRRRDLIRFSALLILNLTLIANIVFLKIKARDEYLYLLKSEIKKIESQASVLQKKMLKVEILQDYLNSGKITLNILAELYRIAPDGLILTSLAISANKPQGAMVLIGQSKGNQMVLIGQAKDNQTVLKFANALKISGLITKADVNYITKRKVSAQEMVDFELKASF